VPCHETIWPIRHLRALEVVHSRAALSRALGLNGVERAKRCDSLLLEPFDLTLEITAASGELVVLSKKSSDLFSTEIGGALLVRHALFLPHSAAGHEAAASNG
jgi:hypothetical protein